MPEVEPSAAVEAQRNDAPDASSRGLWGRGKRRVLADLWIRPENGIPALDGLRGFASVIVVAYHCALFLGFYTEAIIREGRFPVLRAVFNGFWSGIDIFFVLSGFLIGRILILDLIDLDRIRWRKFLIRRSFRIFPAYYLVLLSSLFVFAPTQPGLIKFLYLGASWDGLASGAWTNFVYLNNYLLDPAEPNILSWGWSLCVEEHFYAVLPPFLWLAFRTSSRAGRLLLLSGGILLPVLFRTLAFIRDPELKILDGLYYHSHNRFDEIFVGVVIAYCSVAYADRLRDSVRRARHWVPTLGIVFIAIVWIAGGLQKQGGFIVIGQFLLMALGSGLLLLNGLYLDNPVSRFFAHRAWYPLARTSYGTYLIHPFVMFGLLTVFRGPFAPGSLGLWGTVLLSISTLLVTSILTAAMFVLLERPLLDRGARLSQRFASVSRPPVHPAPSASARNVPAEPTTASPPPSPR